MRISVLGSGSKGNSTLIQMGSTTLMVDCGFGLRETQKRLLELSIDPVDIDAVLVTHEHQDHIAGVEPLAAKFGLNVFMTEGTSRVWKSRGRVIAEQIRAGTIFEIGDIAIEPVSVPHDAREPVQFIFSHAGQHVGVLTDLGCLTKHILDSYTKCQTLLIEANHDLQMLNDGRYPYSLKRRVGGDWGHLNNQQTVGFISQLALENNLCQVIIGHISEQNNQLELIQTELEQQQPSVDEICFALQNETLGWVDLPV